MCGRYASSVDPDDLAEEFELRTADLPRLAADYNVAPTKEVYGILERPAREPDGRPEQPAERRQLRVLRWGLVPSWAKDPSIGNRMINARMETLAEKPAFRAAFARRRVILPADGYYEWYQTAQVRNGKPVKQPYFIRPKDGGLLAMAGLYELWRDPTRAEDDPQRWRWTCTVITTEASDDLGRIHDRMPLMLDRADYAAWLDPTVQDPAALRALLRPAAPGVLDAYPVASLVSNVRNNGPELVAPLPLVETPAGTD